MIDFKYHVVSLISVFLAIALGIIIGTTALNGAITDNLNSQVKTLTNDKRDLEARVSSSAIQIQQNSAFDAAVAPTLVKDVLADQSFITITAGDSVTAEQRDAIIKMTQAAGAKNTGSISLSDSYSDPKSASTLMNYATSDLPAGVTVAQSSNTGTVVGSLIANMIVTPKDGSPAQPGASITAVLSGLGGLGVLKLDSTDISPAQNIVIVTSGKATDEAKKRNATLLALASELDKKGAAVVIAGDLDSAASSGLIGAAKTDASIASRISTVDNSNFASGQISVVWALAAEANGKSGQYGAAKDAQPIPPTPK
ncbi:copper transport outer membrane protein MctB [Antricoccus suffuscus]|uniref:Copper transport outer membrane protein MctB n=1 Tax=Antricoccus suffuscus TaxID=1629062 RepID=A0A2T0ZX60_9ACTN|nr:copper transporter [Antricoccus suffuscus]PRZ40941.1 copper transport outer membrane protein MctB [Antricoccus suffuscus]